MADINVRFSVDEATHKKVLQLQGLFAFKEGFKTNIQDLYIRLVQSGIVEEMKKDGRTNFK